MTTTESKKALSHLVCQASMRASETVLRQELERNEDDLYKGILSFPKPTTSSLEAFTKKRNMASKLSSFIVELSKFLQVEEESTKTLLQTYLSGKGAVNKFVATFCLKILLFQGDFRGTKDSLKKLVNDERCQKPLLCDIWQFYQAERLYILRILKEILTQLNLKVDSKHTETFKDIFKKLDEKGRLKRSLTDQLRFVIEAEPPSSAKNGKHFSKDLVSAWTHYNLRVQVKDVKKDNALKLQAFCSFSERTVANLIVVFLPRRHYQRLCRRNPVSQVVFASWICHQDVLVRAQRRQVSYRVDRPSRVHSCCLLAGSSRADEHE